MNYDIEAIREEVSAFLWGVYVWTGVYGDWNKWNNGLFLAYTKRIRGY